MIFNNDLLTLECSLTYITMKKIIIDVMILVGVKYYDTLTFLWDEKKPLTEEWIHEYVISKRPTLKYQPFTVVFN